MGAKGAGAGTAARPAAGPGGAGAGTRGRGGARSARAAVRRPHGTTLAGCRTEPHDRRTQLLPRGRGIRRGAAYAWQQGLRANNRSPSAQVPGGCGFGLAPAAAEAPPRRPRTAVAAAVRPKAELHHPQSAASDRERSRQVGSRSARRGSPPPTPARAAVSAAPNLSSRCCGGCGASSAGSGSGSGSGPGSPAAAPHNTANVRRLSVASQPSQLWSKRLPSLLRHSRQRRGVGGAGSDQLRRLRL